MKAKIILLFFLFTLVTISEEYGQAYTWIPVTNFGGIARCSSKGFSIGGKGYIGGGNDNSTIYSDFWAFDTINAAWTQEADLGGHGRTDAACFSIGSKGYYGMGWNSTTFYSDFWEYDPETNVWTRKADYGGVSAAGSVFFSIGNKGYVGTGWDGSNVKSDFWEYDPSSDKWTKKADFGGGGRETAVGLSIGNNGYIGTGDDGIGHYYHDFWEYDTTANTWTAKANFGGAIRTDATAFSIGGKGYIGTGANYNTNIFYNDFWEYDTTANTWTQKTNFGGVGRSLTASFSVGGNGYIGGGQIDMGVSYYTDFWEYTNNTSSAKPHANFSGQSATYCSGTSLLFQDSSTNAPTQWHWIFPGGNPSSWNGKSPPSITYDSAGVFGITLIVSNAFGSDTLIRPNLITIYHTPKPIITQSHDTLFCSHDTAVTYYSWWDTNITDTLSFGATDSFMVITKPGTYWVVVSNAFCYGVSDTFPAELIGIKEELDNPVISIFPNPLTSSSILELNRQLKDAEVVIYNMVGKEMWRRRMNGYRIRVDKGELSSGVYFVRLSYEQKQWIQKILVE